MTMAQNAEVTIHPHSSAGSEGIDIEKFYGNHNVVGIYSIKGRGTMLTRTGPEVREECERFALSYGYMSAAPRI
jgi:hypothetical protein